MTNIHTLVRLRRTLALLLCVTLGIGAAHAAETVTYYHTDALGTPVMESNAAGTVTYTREHRPYGEQALGAAKNGPGFTGHMDDIDTGLTYMQARYFDPTASRFLSADPMTPDVNTGDNYNRYWYANNNPFKFIDPDGRVPRGSLDLCSNGCSMFDGGGGGDGRDDSAQKDKGQDEAEQIANEYKALNRRILQEQGETLKEAGIFAGKEAGWMILGEFGGKGLSKFFGGALRYFRISSEAKKIAGGHAFLKHISEFSGFGVRTERQFARHIDNVMANPTAVRELARGRTAFWDARTGTVVIRDMRSADGGTAFIPRRGIDYFNGLE